MKLSAPQRDAVLHPAPDLSVNSTAGSGKTRVAVCRAARLAQSGVPTLLLSFNRAAAEEMTKRLQVFGFSGARAMTLAAAAYRVAKSGLEIGGVDPRGEEPQDRDRAKEWRAFLNDLVRETWCRQRGQELSRKEFVKLCREVRSYAQKAVSLMVPVASIRPPRGDARYIHAAAAALEFMRSRGWTGFSSIDLSTEYALHVLDRGGPPEGFDRVGAIIVDEAQDLCPLQWSFVDGLAEETGADLTIVGDSDQTIYEWRQADLDEFLARCREYSRVDLSHNYRCGQDILGACSRLILANEFRVAHEIQSGASHRGSVELVDSPNGRDEANLLVGRIRATLGQHSDELGRAVTPDDFAVLARTNADRAGIELALFRAGVPYRTRGAALWESPEVELVMSGLRVAHGRDEFLEDALLGLPGVGPMTVRRAQQGGGDLLAGVVERARGRGKISAVGLRSIVETEGETLDSQVRGLCRVYLGDDDGEEDEAHEREVAAALTDLAGRFDSLADLETFLGDVVDENRPAVTVSTIHRTKGQEWAFVYVLRVNEGSFPHARAEGQREVEAERRLLYVAMTRAIHTVVVSTTQRDAFGKRARPSRFLTDAGILDEVPGSLAKFETGARGVSELVEALGLGESGGIAESRANPEDRW